MGNSSKKKKKDKKKTKDFVADPVETAELTAAEKAAEEAQAAADEEAKRIAALARETNITTIRDQLARATDDLIARYGARQSLLGGRSARGLFGF